ncbi:MAG: hypothetical protein ACRC8A_02630 [Microcoleaceae cyanobacterium]
MNTTRLVSVSALSNSEREALYLLFSTHFEGVKPEIFTADLNEKNWVILLESKGILKGFSTLLFYTTQFKNTSLNVIYSGDTIVDPSAWSSPDLSKAWIATVQYLQTTAPENKLYWLLISSGYRTYRFLPIFWKAFFPRYDVTTPTWAQDLTEFLASNRFGQYYDPSTGIVRFPSPQILRSLLQGIPSERLRDPHISFFQTQNPSHFQGDELVCLTEICEPNLTPAGRRMWFNQSLKLEICDRPQASELAIL